MDMFADDKMESKIILESPVNNANQFYISVVKPREYEDDERIRDGLSLIFKRGVVTHLVKPESVTPTYANILSQLDDLKSDSVGKPHYIDAINEIRQKIIQYMNIRKLVETQFIMESFVQVLRTTASEAMRTYRVNDKAGLYAWALSRETLKSRIRQRYSKDNPSHRGVTTDQIVEIIEGRSRLVCFSISDPYTIKELVINLSNEFLRKRKREFKVRPYILFVFDEAQEFVADLSSSKELTKSERRSRNSP